MQNPETALEILKNKDATLMPYLQDIKITTSTERKKYEELIIFVRQAFNRADEMRRSLVDPLNLSVKRINDLFRPYTDQLKNGEGKILKALHDYRTEQKELTDAKVLSEAEAYWQRRKEAEGTGEVVPLPSLNSDQPVNTSHTNMGTVSYSELYDVQIINPDLVPRDLCTPDLKKIRLRAQSGITDIPGCLIGKKLSLRTRSYK